MCIIDTQMLSGRNLWLGFVYEPMENVKEDRFSIKPDLWWAKGGSEVELGEVAHTVVSIQKRDGDVFWQSYYKNGQALGSGELDKRFLDDLKETDSNILTIRGCARRWFRLGGKLLSHGKHI